MKELTTGVSIQLSTDMIGRKAFTEGYNAVSYEATKKLIQRLNNLNFENIDEKERDNYMKFIQNLDTWLLWAREQGYLYEFQREALVDLYFMLSEGASCNIPLEKNIAEYYFCYVFAKVLYFHLETYMEQHGEADKYEALQITLSRFDIWSSDEDYRKACNPMTGCLDYLGSWFKDVNSLIKYWESKIDSKGSNDTPIEIKSAFKRWKNGKVPSWALVKIFFQKDMEPPKEFYIDDEDITEKGFRCFQSILIEAYLLVNLFDSLKKQHILSPESCKMIKDGVRLYYREVFVTRNPEHCDYSVDIEQEAKSNLMFRTLYCILEGGLSEISGFDFLKSGFINPEFPMVL